MTKMENVQRNLFEQLLNDTFEVAPELAAIDEVLSEDERLLDEIGREHSPCPTVRRLLQRRIEENRREIARLTALQARMESAVALWDELPDGYPHDDVMCPLIEGASVKQ